MAVAKGVAKGVALPSLVDYGVSALADLVYRVLAVFGPLSVGDISGSLELPTRQVRLALDELTALGAAAPAAGGAGGHTDDRLWSGRSPAKVLELLHRLRSQSAQDRQRLLAKLARLGYPSALGDPAELHMSGIRSLTSSDQQPPQRHRMLPAPPQIQGTRRFPIGHHATIRPSRPSSKRINRPTLTTSAVANHEGHPTCTSTLAKNMASAEDRGAQRRARLVGHRWDLIQARHVR